MSTLFWEGTNVPISHVRRFSALTSKLWTEWLGEHIKNAKDRELKALATRTYTWKEAKKVWKYVYETPWPWYL